MKLKTFAAALAATTIAGSAFAADLPSRKAAPAYIPPAPIMTWAGFYAGLNAGYGWSAGSTRIDALPVFFAPTWDTELSASSALASSRLNGGNNGGFIGGAQIGWNWQSGALVAGVETDIQWLSGNRTGGAAAGALVPVAFPGELIVSSSAGSSRVNWLGTLRGRLGFTVTPSLLAYVTGGLAYGGVSSSATIFQQNLPFVPPFFSSGASSTTRIGYTIGAGGEWMIAQNWSVKGEYLFYDLGSASTAMAPLSFNPVPVLYTSLPTIRSSYKGHVVRVGLNYHFGGAPAPVVAKY
ncbi:MAG: porin family protein [Rhodoblastus sp.]|nr:porin family protein [Rhodoblastus sp.]